MALSTFCKETATKFKTFVWGDEKHQNNHITVQDSCNCISAFKMSCLIIHLRQLPIKVESYLLMTPWTGSSNRSFLMYCNVHLS